MQCKNYRAIKLLTTTYKVFAKILHLRLKPYAEKILGSYQSGFRQGKSTIDQIFTLRQILEKTKEFNIETHHLFIDFRSAYDSVKRKELYIAMREFEIPEKLIRLTKMTMEKSQNSVKIQTDITDPFQTWNGLRQGDSLSCLLFNLVLEKIVRDAGIQLRGNIYYKSVQLLAYADDVDIIGRTEADIKKTFIALNEAAVKMGLQVNEEKTKYMICNENKKKIQGRTDQQLKIGENRFEKVQSFVYLGSQMNVANSEKQEINIRI